MNLFQRALLKESRDVVSGNGLPIRHQVLPKAMMTKTYNNIVTRSQWVKMMIDGDYYCCADENRKGDIVHMMMSWHEDIFHFTNPLWGESAFHWWIPLTKRQ